MADETKFLPRRQLGVINYSATVHGTTAAAGYNPAKLDWTPADVLELGTLVADNQTVMAEINALQLALQAKRKSLSGSNGIYNKLVRKVRSLGNTARNSSASNAELAAIGISRRNLSQTSRNVPQEAPEFNVTSMTFGVINLVFREAGSAAPRARAKNARGVQIAVVDDAKPVTANEADTAPNVPVSRSPASLDSTWMPARVRLYARWIAQNGQHGLWSVAVAVSKT